MHRLSSIGILFLLATLGVPLWGQNVHGIEFKMDCASCHDAGGWAIEMDSIHFNHDTTNFQLDGTHALVNCKSCHVSLVFNEARQDCASCHLDVHSMSVGSDCARCHNSNTWLVDIIPEIHEENGFALAGAHSTASCVECHFSETYLRFERIGNACSNCHIDDYNNSTSPNHNAIGFSTTCSDCHDIFSLEWETDKVKHDFFPLAGGHDIQDCAQCHTSSNYSDISSDCVACHLTDFNNTATPDHNTTNFSTDCILCHTTDPDWHPASFTTHDELYFPIYSGAHEGEWSECLTCHTTLGDYSSFNCIACHANPETDNEHDGISGYVYEDHGCLACHPSGDTEMAFDHDASNFPLTGAHMGAECLACHQDGFEGTSTTCVECHSTDFQGSLNPNHVQLDLPTDCASCHTTDPEWMPASFDIHDDYFQLVGAHAEIATDCASCHNGDYTTTPNTCAGCHVDEFNNTSSPDHVTAQFSLDCITCHDETAWLPSTFDHDGQYFPIYTGKHEGEWMACQDCHSSPGDFTIFTCIGCHVNPETDDEHMGVNGYVFEDNACLACHPTGDADMTLDHDATSFPLTGAHDGLACLECHSDGFEGTTTVCLDCHNIDFQGSLNPNHVALNLPTDCASCHTTDPEWMPATFDIHDDFYELVGAHAVVANDCASCHNGDFINTPNACAGCHIEDYDNTTNPDHAATQFSTDCKTCHTEASWSPSTFEHDGQYFPIYSGMHDGEWMACQDCHTTPGDHTVFTCTTCHANPETDMEHTDVTSYVFEDNACLACHPTGDADVVFDHAMTNFLLTGGHDGPNCLACHSEGYEGTTTICVDCHTQDFQSSLNPNHSILNIPTDCASCHTTDPEWMPATFDIHDDYYQLVGAHSAVATDCAVCHNGDYVNTPNNCVGCHMEEYDATVDPDHEAAQFSTDCITCHSENSWTPSTFDHDGLHFPIYTGVHAGEWSACLDCHTIPDDFTVNTCISCHVNPDTDNEHMGVNGYVFQDDACLACHPTGDADMPFNHDATMFSLTGAHDGVDCLSCHSDGYEGTTTVCVDCHTLDFDGSLNPNHVVLNIPTDCVTCHTTDPEWMPATFDIHDDYFQLTGAHTLIANDCAICHNGDYLNTPNNCAGCHLNDYTSTSDPDHEVAQFSLDCTSCHTEDSWTPSTFDHDNQYFPIYSGSHDGEWSSCMECHTAPDDFSLFSCTICHVNPETDGDHAGVGGYVYEDNACFICHPMGEADDAIDHNQTNFPLTGAHLDVDCIACHGDGYQGTPTDCFICHELDYNESTNPDHQALNLSLDCAICHTTDPDWNPATFDVHDTYYALTGAHVPVADDCVLCHNGDYNSTPNTCAGCHIADYNESTNPDHQTLNIPTDCTTCHTTDPGWMPASFDIHDTYYPLTGAHIPAADDCILCHNGDYNSTPNTCAGCHIADYNQSTNPDHQALNIPTDCATCHTTDPGWMPASFDIHDTYYPLTGAHIPVADDCILCHNGDYNSTPNTCAGCHIADYNESTNPDHQTLNIPTDCATCHTTDPGWMPASFDIHDTYYPLTGAHIPVADDCVLCHNGDYNSTPNTCAGCHQADYDQTLNPDHGAIGIPNDCASCHTTDPNWMPATFDIHDDYYQLNGAHASIADQCALCHNGDYNNTPNTCVDCHLDDYNNTNDPDHAMAQFPTDCIQCHNESAWEPSTFDHDGMYFPIYSGKHDGEWNTCMDCHFNSNDYSLFSCIDCHEHDNQAEVDDDHDGVSGYEYNSNACYTCHPTGEE